MGDRISPGLSFGGNRFDMVLADDATDINTCTAVEFILIVDES
jgi:hypothetical protein